MRRVPARPVRACILRKWCPVSHVIFEAPLRTSHIFTLHTPHYTLHTPHFTLHTSHSTLHTPHFISSELFSPYPSSSLLISSLLICHLSFHESLPSTTSTRELACASQAVRACFVRSCYRCKVSHHHSLSVFLCDVKSHTKVSHHPSLSVFLCDVKSHTTLH